MVEDNCLDLVGNTDAQYWAEKFVKMVKEVPGIPTDEGTMLGWFANAIMAGYDWGVADQRKRGFHEMIREIAFQAAGVGSGAVMKDAPDVVMPSEDITIGVNLLLASFGVEGYEVVKGETMGIEFEGRRTAPGRDAETDPHEPGVLHRGGEEVVVDPDLKAEAEAKQAEEEPTEAA